MLGVGINVRGDGFDKPFSTLKFTAGTRILREYVDPEILRQSKQWQSAFMFEDLLEYCLIKVEAVNNVTYTHQRLSGIGDSNSITETTSCSHFARFGNLVWREWNVEIRYGLSIRG